MTLEAQQILANKYGIGSNVWSVTSYTELRREAHAVERWNMLHPTQQAKKTYLETVLQNEQGVFISVSDNVRAVGEQISRWVPGDYYVLGTDGMGRSETREALRRHFEVDAESIAIATLYRLAKQGVVPATLAGQAIQELGVDPEKADPLRA